jgi:hypothetical protein
VSSYFPAALTPQQRRGRALTPQACERDLRARSPWFSSKITSRTCLCNASKSRIKTTSSSTLNNHKSTHHYLTIFIFILPSFSNASDIRREYKINTDDLCNRQRRQSVCPKDQLGGHHVDQDRYKPARGNRRTISRTRRARRTDRGSSPFPMAVFCFAVSASANSNPLRASSTHHSIERSAGEG